MRTKGWARVRAAAARLWRRDKKLYLALAGVCAAQLELRLLMRSPAASAAAVRFAVRPYHRLMGRLCSFLPFSAAEVCWAALVLFCVWYAARTVWLLIRPPAWLEPALPAAAPAGAASPPGAAARRKSRLRPRLAVLWRRVLGGVLTALAVYTGYTALWGLVYYGPTFEQQAGLAVRPITVDELEAVTRLFVEKLNAAAPQTQHRAPGVLTGDTDAIFRASDTLYDALERRYPFLQPSPVRPKQMLFSRVMSVINYTGVFFPFTGEANLNVDAPECLLPATIAHELAHVHGVAPEQTANFLAILACDTCGDPLYAYSGYLLGYIHLSNALYGASYDRWLALAGEVCETANEDLRANNAYWKQFESPVAEAADSAYSGFLKSYDQELGSKSYGAVVDLLAAYYVGA